MTKINKSKKQWQKRVDITQYIYACLIKNFNAIQIKKDTINYNLDANQIKIIEYYADNKNTIEQLFIDKLKQDWSWDRIAAMQKAIMIVAYCEYKVMQRAKAIAIDQALVTADQYGQLKEKSFINAILDKILK